MRAYLFRVRCRETGRTWDFVGTEAQDAYDSYCRLQMKPYDKFKRYGDWIDDNSVTIHSIENLPVSKTPRGIN